MNTEEPIGILVKTSLVDFPGRVAAALFLSGCNLRCPYCYNTELVAGKLDPAEAVSSLQVLAHLEKRKNVLSGFVISGGEPLLSPITEYLIIEARKLGYKIKLDTNGTFPEKLEYLLKQPHLRPDFIALDVKTIPSKYGICMQNKEKKHTVSQSIIQSIQLLSALPAQQREFRTVLVPGMITGSDIEEIAALLPHDAGWQFANFRPGGCLDPSYDHLKPYTDSEIQDFIEKARRIIPGAALR